ncbi:hypothetical protein ACFLZW_04255 [Chloroflexota bacterium]
MILSFSILGSLSFEIMRIVVFVAVILLNWNLIGSILFGKGPPFPNIVTDSHEHLPSDGLPMGTLIVGRQGSGKTVTLARQIVGYFRTFWDRAIFVLDWSGSISDTILSLILLHPKEQRDWMLRRLVYDELGNPDWIIPMPEFSSAYGSTYEEQVQRVSANFIKLAPELVEGAPFLAGLAIREIAPQICRLLTAIEEGPGKSWQITEAKKLLVDSSLLNKALKEYGYKVPEAKWFLEKVFTQINRRERELRSYAFTALLGTIEPRAARARVGYHRPGWTPEEVIDRGLMVLVDGSRLINQRNTQHYLFTQVYSLIMAEINKRQPGNPYDKPVALVMDEVYSLLSIPGMAEEIAMLAPLYRSRKLELYIVLQALSQLAPALREQIWSIGNIICFALSNLDEAYEIGQQLFSYEPLSVKLPARDLRQHPVVETDRGQFLSIANQIQRLQHRECIIRRYLSEQSLDRHVRHIPRTMELPVGLSDIPVGAVKEMLIRQRGVLVKDALSEINSRTLGRRKPPQV